MENGEERGKRGRERETLILREKAGCPRVERKKRVDSFVFIVNEIVESATDRSGYKARSLTRAICLIKRGYKVSK